MGWRVEEACVVLRHFLVAVWPFGLSKRGCRLEGCRCLFQPIS